MPDTLTKKHTHLWRGRPVSEKQYHHYLHMSGGNVPKDSGPVDSTPDVGDDVAAILEQLNLSSDQVRTIAQVFAAQKVDPTQVAKPKRPSVDEQSESLVANSKYAYSRGRVYINGDVAEAAARVLTGGKPEIVAVGAGKTAAVLVSRTDAGNAYLHNLYEAS